MPASFLLYPGNNIHSHLHQSLQYLVSQVDLEPLILPLVGILARKVVDIICRDHVTRSQLNFIQVELAAEYDGNIGLAKSVFPVLS